MATPSEADVYGGPIPTAAWYLLLDLTGRGLRVSRRADGMLLVSPGGQLSDAEQAAIRMWKYALLQLVDFACCAGGGPRVECRLCPRSPSYWRRGREAKA